MPLHRIAGVEKKSYFINFKGVYSTELQDHLSITEYEIMINDLKQTMLQLKLLFLLYHYILILVLVSIFGLYFIAVSGNQPVNMANITFILMFFTGCVVFLLFQYLLKLLYRRRALFTGQHLASVLNEEYTNRKLVFVFSNLLTINGSYIWILTINIEDELHELPVYQSTDNADNPPLYSVAIEINSEQPQH
ncbi:hypothetical protein BC833DRAFT_661358 [Globomyces pollinis-pini]|nr:hypothetical protein BC833DRAFT_661358 [Globomyces pollinis-pini]